MQEALLLEKKHIGLALDELERIGLSKEKVLTKPVTFKEYRDFLKRVNGWILGINVSDQSD